MSCIFLVSGYMSHISSYSKLSFLGSTEALEFAQSKLAPFGKVQKYVVKLEVCSVSCELLYIYTYPVYHVDE